LVNNAAITGSMTRLEGTTTGDMDLVYAVNMRAPMICTRHLLNSMQTAGYGRIVNIASRAHLGKTHRTSYAGTKGALVSMTRVWAIELAKSGITCNAVAPGPVRTELFETANPPDMPRTQQIIDAIPVGRIGESEDIANAVSFFADPRAGFVTGQVLYVCGGTTLTRGGS
jgi:NAD(P)-dependent dehydrogenase (short-subunit alcohol dehydrogenase family)